MSLAGVSPALLVACVAVAALGGLTVPALLRALPQPAPAPDLPTHERPVPTYASLAARPGLGWRCAGTSGLVAAVLVLALGADPALVGLVPLAPVGVALGLLDARTRLLPRVVVLPATGVLLVLAVVGAVVLDAGADLRRALLGLLLARSAFWVLWRVRSAGLGFGDVRLAALLGLALGWLGWPSLVLGLYAGFLLLGVPGALLALVRRDAALLRSAHPFGPFLLVGALLGVVLAAPFGRALGGA